MGISYKGIGHAAFYCNDIAKMRHFYEDQLDFEWMCGMEDDGDGERIGAFKIPGGQYIEVYRPETMKEVSASDNKQTDHSFVHCCFEIDARHQAYRDLTGKGLPVQRLDGGNTVAREGTYCSFIQDPENNQWELMEFSHISWQIVKDTDN